MMLELKNIHKKLGKFKLKDISFELPKGYICGLIGPNGAGKTTLIHLLLGLYEPDEGELLVNDKLYDKKEADIRNEIGVVLSEDLFETRLTLLENAKEYGRFYKEYDVKALEDYLSRFGLEGRQKFGKLSKGQKLKFQFAFALSHNPKLLILDEPTGNFDPAFREEFFKIIKGFIADGEKSVVLATHLTEDLDRFADYILYLEKGQMVFAGDIETLRQSYRILVGEEYKMKLLKPEKVIHVEPGTYGTRALVKHRKIDTYDSSFTVTIPTIEELMYFITKRGK